jgi:hypothetical protein
VLALVLGAQWPGAVTVVAAGLLGFASYGASLALFVIGLRHLGSARTGAYFSIAPFVGAALAIALLDETLSWPLLVAGALMAVGLWLHLTESHQHFHTHEPLEHSHMHDHGSGDPHHAHAHDEPSAPGTRHAHFHRHAAIAHTHAHFPDAHHRHSHEVTRTE